jgi:hypothetical protein
MARWKLMTAHYLNVPGEQWEYQETDRKTGRMLRTQMPVPRLLDPRDPSNWTNRWGNKDNEEGEIVVCLKGKGDTHDIVFEGDPTPDMIPVDEEAIAINASFAERWRYKPEAATDNFSQSLIDRIQMEMAPKATPAPIEGLGELVTAIKALVESNVEVVKQARRV